MKWLAGIDVPMTVPVSDAQVILLADVLRSLGRQRFKLLFRNELYAICNGGNLWNDYRVFSYLANLEVEQYESSGKAQYIKSVPDLDDPDLAADVREEERQLLFALHHSEKLSRVYLAEPCRAAGMKLETIVDKKGVEHHLISVSSGNDVDSFVKGHSPLLNQLKHGMFKYSIAGYDVSTFSAYDKNDESAAKNLLERSFDDYQGVVDPGCPPDDLFTWDSAHRCYVCFHHSGNWEYHGFDITPAYIALPDHIKEKYHIWK